MIESILVPLDGSAFAERVLPCAAALAQAHDLPLELVRVRSGHGGHETLESDHELRACARAPEYLECMARTLSSGGTRVHATLLEASDVADAIAAHATRVRARMIAMATHGRIGLGRYVFGSVADAVVRSSTIPVLLWPATAAPAAARSASAFGNVLVPLDGSAAAEAILPHAARFATLGGGRVTLVRVVPHSLSVPEPSILIPLSPFLGYAGGVAAMDDRATERVASHALAHLAGVRSRIQWEHPTLPVDVRVLVDERVGAAIVGAADDAGADIVAMTREGHGATRLVVGSTVDFILRHWTGALLLLRPLTA